MLSGPLIRTRKTQKRYHKHLKTASACDFCNFKKSNSQVKKETDAFWIVDNIFGYDLWDGQGVTVHLMVVPKKHVTRISELGKKAQDEYLKILNDYEDKGFSIYSRSAKNKSVSVLHKHTHLIKMDDKKTSVVLYARKPHFLIKF